MLATNQLVCLQAVINHECTLAAARFRRSPRAPDAFQSCGFSPVTLSNGRLHRGRLSRPGCARRTRPVGAPPAQPVCEAELRDLDVGMLHGSESRAPCAQPGWPRAGAFPTTLGAAAGPPTTLDVLAQALHTLNSQRR